MRDPLQKTSRSQIHAVQRQQHAHRLKRLLRIHRLARLFHHDLQDPAKPHLCAGKEMMRAEYEKLIATAKENGNLRLAMIIEIIGSTGMRISELASVTVEAVSTGKISISCKGKHREIYLVHKLKMKLLDYCKKKGIRSGAVFITKNGNPVDRSNIWTEMKKNAEKAGVALEKAFPHNLRHFFARVYYSIHKNISQLADILGHSSINTTRIYLATTEEDHVKKLERLDLVV